MKNNGYAHFQAWILPHQKQAIEAYLNFDNQAIDERAVKLIESAAKKSEKKEELSKNFSSTLNGIMNLK